MLTGAITKTSTKEECANAAIPDVGVAYKIIAYNAYLLT
jgi:hypothetical protein